MDDVRMFCAPLPQTKPRALDDLYRCYSVWLRRRLRSRFGEAMAEDLVQETYAKLAPLTAEVALRHPKAFLLQVATNLGRDELRRARRARAAAPDLPAAESGACAVETASLSAMLRTMPDDQRTVFVLSRFGRLTYEEIAERTGLSVKAVEWRMTRALQHCTTHLRS